MKYILLFFLFTLYFRTRQCEFDGVAIDLPNCLTGNQRNLPLFELMSQRETCNTHMCSSWSSWSQTQKCANCAFPGTSSTQIFTRTCNEQVDEPNSERKRLEFANCGTRVLACTLQPCSNQSIENTTTSTSTTSTHDTDVTATTTKEKASTGTTLSRTQSSTSLIITHSAAFVMQTSSPTATLITRSLVTPVVTTKSEQSTASEFPVTFEQGPSWSSWGSWSYCTDSCNIGVKLRTRYCSEPFQCEGSNHNVETCNTQECKVSCHH